MFSKIFRRGQETTVGDAVVSPSVGAGPAEARSSDRPSIQDMMAQGGVGVQLFGMGVEGASEVVTIESALQVPAFWNAAHFLARTMATLPVKSFEKKDGGRVEITGDAVSLVLNEAANDETSSYKFRFGFWLDYFTAGRGMAFIDRNQRGELLNLWPLEPSKTTVRRTAGLTRYHYGNGGKSYAAADVLDLSFFPASDRVGAHSPVYTHVATLGLALAVTRYGSRFFKNGGVPPFAIVGPISTPGGLQRAGEDLTQAVIDASEKGSNAIAVPEGHTLVPLGIDPEKMQQIDVQRFLVEQIARIFGMPPAFLQDLTHGSFSNVTQQDLTLSKHVIAPHVVGWDQETNLKLYGRKERKKYCETSLAGLLRGDFKARAEANASKLNTGQLTINESRAQENLPAVAGGDVVLVQGAMIPADRAGMSIAPGQTAEK